MSPKVAATTLWEQIKRNGGLSVVITLVTITLGGVINIETQIAEVRTEIAYIKPKLELLESMRSELSKDTWQVTNNTQEINELKQWRVAIDNLRVAR